LEYGEFPIDPGSDYGSWIFPNIEIEVRVFPVMGIRYGEDVGSDRG